MGLLDEVISKVSCVMADNKGEQSGLLEGVMQMLDKQGAGGLGPILHSAFTSRRRFDSSAP
jgi:hypothetical protein